MKKRTWVLAAVLVAATVVLGERMASHAGAPSVERLEGLRASAEVIEDSDGVPHIQAQNDHDAVFLLGWLHARDRLFQMDAARRLFSGRLAELVGSSALSSDVLLRTAAGLRRAAEVSYPAHSASVQALFQAYADGVNAYLQDNSLPAEYAALELSSVEPWTPLDSVTIAKGQAFALSFDQVDLELTTVLDAYESAGSDQGFDGSALFSEDLFRSQPFDSTVSIPNFNLTASEVAPSSRRRPSTRGLQPETLRQARRLLRKFREDPYLRRLLGTRESRGSNWWVIGGQHSESGFPMLANDPHLTLDTPPIFYEAHLMVRDDPRNGPMNVSGVSFAGTPLIAQGCNDRICWGSTVNYMDVTDYFEEFLAVDFVALQPTHTIFDGQREPLVAIPQTFLVNQPGNAQMDDLVDGQVGALEGGITYLVPRRNNGPIVSVDISTFPNVTGISVQYTGFGITREGEAFWRWARAGSLEDFQEGLQFFDIGSQNWAYADVDGNIAYFTSAELPLREDLQTLGRVDGRPPFLVRDGTHFFQNEWLPVQNPQFGQALGSEILPFGEMPQIINPDSGYILNANNDPVGTTLDNDALNQVRPGGGVFYLSPGYTSLRSGRIGRLIEGLIDQGQPLSPQDLMDIQANNQLLDAEIFTPFILQAFENASLPGASENLMTLAADAAVAEAVGRLEEWDFSTPTGIPQGYDPGDDPSDLPQPSQEEISNSVAATIYALWRARFTVNVIDATLERLGLDAFAPPTELALTALRNLLDGFEANQGVGSSGVDFFQVDDTVGPADARDTLILRSIREALDRLASDDLAPAFGNSTDQSDFRWGYLHRIVLDHPLQGPFNLPDGVNFGDLAPELPGLARAGGLGAVDASSHSARSQNLNSFMFGGGPSRRFVGELRPDGIRAYQILPGGQSGVLGSPRRDDQLGRWLTNRYHPLRLSAADVMADAASTLQFAPQQYLLYFPFFEGGPGSFTGFAVSSLLNSTLQLEFSFWDSQGQLLGFPNNPAGLELGAAEQLAQLGSDLAGVPTDTPQSGWAGLAVTPTADQLLGPAVASFTQFGGFQLDRLDGGVALTEPSRQLYFTRVAEGPRGLRGRPASTVLSLANPTSGEVEVALTLAGDSPLPPAPGGRTPGPPAVLLERTLRVPAKGLLRGTLSQIFEQSVEVSRGFVQARVTEGGGIVGFESIQLAEVPTLLGLNASAGTGRRESFSAQLASGPGIFTSLNLLNTSLLPRQVTLRAVGDNGSPLAADVELQLGPGAVFQSDAAQVFEFTGSAGAPAGAGVVEGSIAIRADGDGVIGDVIFGDDGSLQYAAALALQDRPIRRAVFSQVANTPVFFTGLALFSLGEAAANVSIQVFDGMGQLAGEAQLALQPGERTSQLLTELVPASAGQQGGYIVIESDQPLVAQQLFGTFRLSLLSAVPPTLIE